MEYRRFLAYNVIGGIGWVLTTLDSCGGNRAIAPAMIVKIAGEKLKRES